LRVDVVVSGLKEPPVIDGETVSSRGMLQQVVKWAMFISCLTEDNRQSKAVVEHTVNSSTIHCGNEILSAY
jgi:hypothetical protein